MAKKTAVQQYETAKMKRAGYHRVKAHKKKAPKYKKKTQNVSGYWRKNRKKKKKTSKSKK
jgi:hypothetical protein